VAESKVFEVEGKAYQVSIPTVATVKLVERKHGKDSDTVRGLVMLQNSLRVQRGESGVFMPISEIEFDSLGMNVIDIIQQEQNSLSPENRRREMAAGAMLDLLPADAPPEVGNYLVKLLSKAEPDPLA
jgi:hypothetical protein